MKVREAKIAQEERLNKLCEINSIDFKSIKILLNSVKTKKLLKRNNYHQEKINDVIEKAIK